MAIARVQGAGNHTTGVTTPATVSATLGAAVTSGNTVVGMVSFDVSTSTTLTSVTDDKGNTYSLETAITDAGVQRVVAFSRSNITNGPTVVTANFGAPNGGVAIIVDEFSGCSTAGTDQRDGTAHGGQIQAAPGTGANAVSSGSFTTATGGDLVWSGTGSTDTADQAMGSVGTGFTTTGTSSGGSGGFDPQIFSEWLVQSSAGSIVGTWTASAGSAHYGTFMIAIKAAGGGGPAAPIGKVTRVQQTIKRASYW